MRIKATEAETQKAIMEYLAVVPIVNWAIRLNTSATVLEDKHGKKRFLKSHSGGVGLADILVLVDDPMGTLAESMEPDGDAGGIEVFVPLWIECKAEGGKQTPEQESFELDMRRRGHRYVVAYSVDDVTRALKQIRFGG